MIFDRDRSPWRKPSDWPTPKPAQSDLDSEQVEPVRTRVVSVAVPRASLSRLEPASLVLTPSAEHLNPGPMSAGETAGDRS
jgi:hypothetical protein